MLKTTFVQCIDSYITNSFRIDDKEFILLNLEVALTCKTPLPEESIGAFTTLNMGYKQYMQSKKNLSSFNLGKDSYL